MEKTQSGPLCSQNAIYQKGAKTEIPSIEGLFMKTSHSEEQILKRAPFGIPYFCKHLFLFSARLEPKLFCFLDLALTAGPSSSEKLNIIEEL